jgi:hypothetical protein
MGFKDKLTQKYTESYLKKYGDRLTQVQGKVLSVKIQPKTILWIFHKLTVTVLVKPERSKNIVRCIYNKKRWFKKIDFISISQGNSVIIQGLKGKKGKENSEAVEILNIRNLTTKKDLVPMEGAPKVQKVRQDRRYR